MTFAQEYASDFAKQVAVGIVPEQAESVRFRIDDFERMIALAFIAGIDHATAVSFKMVNESIANLPKSYMEDWRNAANEANSQPRMQASELTRGDYIAKVKALEIDWIGTPQMMVDKMKHEGKIRDILGIECKYDEEFQASKPAVFDRSVLDKLPRFDCYSAQSEFYADEEKDGEWVKFEDVERLAEELG